MEKTFSFFRVFDIAFFVPGACLLVGLWRAGIFDEEVAKAAQVSSDTLHALAVGVLAVLFSFLLGMCCHGVNRFASFLSWLRNGKPSGSPWYANLDRDKPNHELAVYFWYLRATCWNTGIACAVIVGLMVYVRSYEWAVIAGLGVPLFLLLGIDFHHAVKRAAS